MISEELKKEFARDLKCDSVRICIPIEEMFLIAQWRRNTAKDREERRSSEQWYRNGEPIDFDYHEEHVVARGKTVEELKKSVKAYIKLKGMTWADVLSDKELKEQFIKHI